MKKWMLFAAAIVCICLLAWFVTPQKAEEASLYDWGVTMMVESLSPSGCKLQVSQSGGNPTGEVECGSDYWIEVQIDGEWAMMEPITDLCWTAEAYLLSGRTQTFDLAWNSIYGELPAGTYRIGKAIMDFRGTGDYDQQKHYTPPFPIE